MNVYVESNFVLELAFIQEQQASCENILRLCEAGKLRVLVPAYSLVEPYERMFRRIKDSKALQARFASETMHLLRSKLQQAEKDVLQQAAGILARSIEEEEIRLDATVTRLLKSAEIIPLSVEVLTRTQGIQTALELGPQDAVVYASVTQHLALSPSLENCFLDRNFKDFKKPDIKNELKVYNCKILYDFDDGLKYIQSQLKTP